MHILLISISMIVFGAACATSGAGTFSSNGFIHRDSDFNKGIEDFMDFISRISVGGRTGAEFQEKREDMPPAAPSNHNDTAQTPLAPAPESTISPPAAQNE